MKRDPLEQMLVRAPALAGLIAKRARQAPPGSQVRRRLMGAQVTRAFAAMARSDVDLVLMSFDPHVEVRMHGMEAAGISGVYRGHDGIRALYADIDSVFDEWRWTVRALVDGGDRLAVRADFVGRGRGSGVETSVSDSGTAFGLSPDGLVTWQDWYAQSGSWPQVLQAAGLCD